MSCLVGTLEREHLLHFAIVRMQLTEMTSRHDQRRVLVFDQEGHDLSDGGFNRGIDLERCVPVDGGLWVPLSCDALTIDLARGRGPAVRRDGSA